ncbi:MAG: PASTA domain-containing protein [Treponema sp.]|nr:PASTA domain-containing protein [Treponema sp.]
MNFNKFKFGIDFTDTFESLQKSGKAYIITAILMVVIMAVTCGIVFFAVVKGSEEVLVPNVVGKELTKALEELQVKELYPKIQLRYSNNPDEKGLILDQNPPAGTIIKASRRVNLIVSRGVIIDKVEDYTNQKFDDVKVHLQTLFTGTRAMITLQDPPFYVSNIAEAGTILEQNPPADTIIIDPIKLELVVSKGPEFEKTKVPPLTGLSVNDTLLQISRSKVIFDFTTKIADITELPGTIVSQEKEAGSWADVNGRVNAVLAIPEKQTGDMVYGIFSETLPKYPYALQLQLDVQTYDGERYNLVTLNHPGGNLTIPYYLQKNSILILSIENSRDVMRKTIQ